MGYSGTAPSQLALGGQSSILRFTEQGVELFSKSRLWLYACPMGWNECSVGEHGRVTSWVNCPVFPVPRGRRGHLISHGRLAARLRTAATEVGQELDVKSAETHTAARSSVPPTRQVTAWPMSPGRQEVQK